MPALRVAPAAMWILIVVTFIGGSAWGPTVSMQEFTSKPRCEAAKAEVLKAIAYMGQTNLTGGAPRREMVRAACQEK